VSYNDNDSRFYAVAFQSHELMKIRPDNSTYYKIAFTPPHALKERFAAIVSDKIYAKLIEMRASDDSVKSVGSSRDAASIPSG
jgi:hypothetical protein